MLLRPRASLGRVLDDLGDALLDLVVGNAEDDQEIGGVMIHDPIDEVILPPHALVLGVSLRDPDDIRAVIDRMSADHAVGLILRAPVIDDAEMRKAATRGGVALLALRAGASWSHLVTLLRAVLAEEVGVGESESLGGIPSGDLFAVANAIASLMDAPVTIEDRQSRVLAFSGRQDEADEGRVETILGRQVPERYMRALAERGVLRDLERTEGPIFVEPAPTEGGGFSIPRLAVAVRAGDEFLGSIWVAARGALSAERESALRDAAKLAALHLLRVRAGADVQRRLHTDLLSTALEGGPGALSALSRLGLAHRSLMTMGVMLHRASEVSVGADVVRAGDQARIADAFTMHLTAVHPAATAALVGDAIYGLVPTAPVGAATTASSEEDERRAQRIAQDFLDRIGRRFPAVIAVGPISHDVAALARARVTVDRVLAVLRDGEGARAATLAEVQTEALVLELRALASARGDQPTGSVARLIAYDRENDTDFTETLRTWLDRFGDVTEAAARLFIHPNTLRYRLRRIAGIAAIDVTDPEQRFSAMLQLRVLAPAPTRIGKADAAGYGDEVMREQEP